MYLYWRVNQDLETLGEHIVFNDPRFIRCFKEWVRKNFTSLALAEDDFLDNAITPSNN